MLITIALWSKWNVDNHWNLNVDNQQHIDMWMLANSLIFNMQVACCVHSTNLSIALVLNVVITITVCCRCTPFDTEIHFAI